MIRKYLPLYMVALIFISLAFIYGCGSAATSGGSSTSGVTIVANRVGTYEYSGTQSPGDMWTWMISTETFFGSNESNGFWVSGTWETLSNKFCKAFVNNANNLSAISKEAYFIEFPDTMLLIHPCDANSDNKDNIIVCTAHSSTQPTAGKYVWVTMPWQGWAIGDTAYGSVEATLSGAWSFNVTNFLLTGEPESNVTKSGYTFSDGIMDNTHYPTDPKLFMTPTGVFMGDNGTNGGFAGASVEAINITDLANKNYRGVRFVYNSTSGTNETLPVTAYPNGTNKMIGKGYPNGVEGDPDASNYVGITFEAQDLSSGIIPMYITDYGAGPVTNGTSIYKAVASKVGSSGKYMLFGFGVESGEPTNFLVIQVD